MNGSQKQISWATDIQTKLAEAAKPLIGKNPHADRAINLILAIDESKFWIENKDSDWRYLLTCLYSSGLRNKGNEYSNTIKAEKATHVITETWEVIVSDAKGGHKETKTKVW
jgi:hypothetical protein